MRKRFLTLMFTLGVAGGTLPLVASPQDQSSDSKMAGKMSGSKMSHKQMMDKMDKISAEDKAAMFDHMTDNDKMTGMKMGGHDMSKMSHEDSMAMMSKMSTQDKASMFDKMPGAKRMAMMQDAEKMKHDHMEDKK